MKRSILVLRHLLNFSIQLRRGSLIEPASVGETALVYALKGVRSVAERKWYRGQGELLTPLMVSRICKSGCRLDKGSMLSFRLQLHFLWHVEIMMEKKEWCLPCRYSLTAVCLDAPKRFSRRYATFDKALLHCLNGFNENAAIKDRYTSIEDYLSKNKCL